MNTILRLLTNVCMENFKFVKKKKKNTRKTKTDNYFTLTQYREGHCITNGTTFPSWHWWNMHFEPEDHTSLWAKVTKPALQGSKNIDKNKINNKIKKNFLKILKNA